jgi:hypothetical protein
VAPSLFKSHLTPLVSDSKSLTLGGGKVTEALSWREVGVSQGKAKRRGMIL